MKEFGEWKTEMDKEVKLLEKRIANIKKGSLKKNKTEEI